mgnify:FL=1
MPIAIIPWSANQITIIRFQYFQYSMILDNTHVYGRPKHKDLFYYDNQSIIDKGNFTIIF